MEKPLEEYTPEELYDFKDRLRLLRQSVRGQNGPDPNQTRTYCTEMRKKVNRRLRKLGSPIRRPEDKRVYGPGQVAWQGRT